MTKKTDEETLLDTTAAAEKLGISQRHCWSLIKSGLLPAQRVGRTYVIKESDLESVKDRPKVGRPKKTTKK
jgi:excisionase family DNA binding protein